MKKIAIVFLMFFVIQNVSAQIPSGVSPSDFLKGTNVTQEELKGKLKEKGLDIENISPQDLPQVQGTIEDAIKEIQSQKGQNTGSGMTEDLTVNNELSKEDLEDKFEDLDELKSSQIGKRVEDGASLEEAISEEELSKRTVKGRAASIYGHSIFFDQTLDFYRTTQTSTPPDNYILGVGDKITINIFGRSQADLIYQIENDGFIRPSGMYKIYLKGLPYGKAKFLLRSRFKQAYAFDKGQFNIDLNTARTVRVNIYGEVYNPGSYTISALNSALSAVIAAGGPTENGSVRNITYIVNGKEKHIDVYDFLTNPNAVMEFGLVNNATIFIPPLSKVVNLGGQFVKTGRFELKDGETIEDLIRIAGGTRKNVSLANFNIDRIVNSERRLSTYNFESAKNMELEDLDVITFRNNKMAYENYIFINGAVRFPGDYEWQNKMTVSQVLKDAILEKYSRLDIAYVVRRNDDNTFRFISVALQKALDNPNSIDDIVLQSGDGIKILDIRDFTDLFLFSITGAVRQPLVLQEWDQESQMRLSDAINFANGVKVNATKFGYIIRTSIENPEIKEYKLVNIEEALKSKGSSSDIVIEVGDSIVIPSNERFSDELFVRIGGAVRSSGQFVYSNTLTLKEVIVMAGGVSDEAETKKIDIYRLKDNDQGHPYTTMITVEIDKNMDPLSANDRIEIRPNDVIEVRKIPNYGAIEIVEIAGEVMYPGNYALTIDNERISDIIEKAGGITSEGNLKGGRLTRIEDNVGVIITNFGSLNGRDKSNVIMKHGDKIIIPAKHDIVQISVVGTNASETYDSLLASNGVITVPFGRSNRAGKYIKAYAGGFAKNAKKGRTFVQHKSGRMVKTKNLGLFRIYPVVSSNSQIITTLKVKKSERRGSETKQRDFYGDFKDLLALVTSALTVVVLAKNI
ncbi:MAG: hypothetical protein COA58_01445 [Bacteroidetes bacterium]|nr:MAG: hypothetical protein COA58_01445 [Bacteroidota bacterium]